MSHVQLRPTCKVPRILGRAPPDLMFRGPLEAKFSVRGRKNDPPGAQGRADFVGVTAAVTNVRSEMGRT